MMNNMQNDFNEEPGSPAKKNENEGQPAPVRQRGFLTRWMNALVQMGLGESLLRSGTNLFSIAAIVFVVLLVQAFNRQTANPLSGNSGQAQGPARAVPVR